MVLHTDISPSVFNIWEEEKEKFSI